MTSRVFFAPLSAADDHHLALLTGTELERRQRYVRADDRRRFTLATVLLKGAAAEWLSTGPEDIVVDRTCATCGAPHGRPRIVGRGLHASIAHSGGFVAVALSDVAAVGVDIEVVGDRRYEPLLDDVCAPAERPHVGCREDFYAYWTRKESVLKALGVGLEVPMTEVAVSPPSATPTVTAYRGEALAAQLSDLSPGAGYAGAVTVLTSEAEPVDLTVDDGTRIVAALDADRASGP